MGYRTPVEHPPFCASLEAQYQTLVAGSRGGALTREQFAEIVPDHFRAMRERDFNPHTILNSFMLRERYIRDIGFLVITEGYLNSLTRLVRGRRVLEVCAGKGLLQGLMRGRGIDWTSTDTDPWTGDITSMPALEAVEHFQPEVVFASWVDYGSPLDTELAQRVPCVLLKEDCTGSESLWDRDGFDIRHLPDWFEDVPNWPGIHDRTLMTVPTGQSNPFPE